MSRYRLEIFEPGMLDSVADLRRSLWGRSRSSNRAYLEWKYLQNPYLADPLIYVALAGDRVVGMRGMYGTGWLAPGVDGHVVLPCAADSGIATEYRDQGLFADLTGFAVADLKRRGFQYVINMSATPANYVTSIMTMGWKKVGSYDPLLRTRDPIQPRQPTLQQIGAGTRSRRLVGALKNSTLVRSTVRNLRDLRRGVLAKDPFVELDRADPLRGSQPVQVTDLPRPSVMGQLVAQSARAAAIRHVRDETYYAWRYRNPLATYRFVFLGGDQPQAFLVLHGTEADKAIHVVDWAGDPAGVGDLLDVSILGGKPARVGAWGATVPAEIRSRLDQAGFAPDRSSPMARRGGLIVKSLADGEPGTWAVGSSQLLNLANWDLHMIFSDRF